MGDVAVAGLSTCPSKQCQSKHSAWKLMCQVWTYTVMVHVVCRSSTILFAKLIVRTQMQSDATKRQRKQAAVFCDGGVY